jgi:hypothetical protein
LRYLGGVMSYEELKSAFQNRWQAGYFEYIFAYFFGDHFYWDFSEFTRYKGKIYFVGNLDL